jgi:hypothetical protein
MLYIMGLISVGGLCILILALRVGAFVFMYKIYFLTG